MCIDLQMLSAYLDGELKEPYRTQVEEHLDHCAACRKLLQNMKDLDRRVQSVSFSEEELSRNKDAIFAKLDNKYFKNRNSVSFFRRKVQMSVPQMITAAAAATFIFVGGFFLFGSNAAQTEDILPSFAVSAGSENVRFVSSSSDSLDNYTLEQILQYLDQKGYQVDISIKGLQPLKSMEVEKAAEPEKTVEAPLENKGEVEAGLEEVPLEDPAPDTATTEAN